MGVRVKDGRLSARMEMPYRYDDGGRGDAGFKGTARDCVTRSIAIVTGMDYRRVYNDLRDRTDHYANTCRSDSRLGQYLRKPGKGSPRNGVFTKIAKKYLADLGLIWTPTMGIGTGCRVTLCQGSLPPGRHIVKVSRHFSAVIDGVIYDTHDPSRGGWRCVYGYWTMEGSK